MNIELVSLKAYLGADHPLVELVILLRMRNNGITKWRDWTDDYGFRLTIPERTQFNLEKTEEYYLGDIYYNSPMEEIKRISTHYYKNRDLELYLGRDQKIRVYKKKKRISILSFGLDKALELIKKTKEREIK